jgi:SAM-dependent methyltransferase
MSTNFNENYWEKHYWRSGERHAHLTPSPHILSEVAGLVSGTALDAGCGEGADAIWLAQNGWRVTAVDTSKNALDKAKSSAREAGVDIDWRYADLTTWTPPENSFDLVTSQYVHTTNDHEFYKKLANAVKTGGRLLIVGHQPPASHETSPHAEGSHVTAEHLATSLDADQWEIEVAEPHTSERIAPNGRTSTLRDSVLRAHKR